MISFQLAPAKADVDTIISTTMLYLGVGIALVLLAS